ncbi:MAG: PQQ-binding-like beta-propeller repeat protein [Polyangiaceae bacterium]
MVPPALPVQPNAAGNVVGGILTLVILAVIGGVIAFSVARGGKPGSGSGPGAGGVVPDGERLQWDSWNHSGPIVTDVNGDGVEDFVGPYKILDLRGKSTQTAYIGAFDGKTFQRIWASPALGTLEQTAGKTAFGVAGDRVIVTDFRAQAHILDLKTGRELRAFKLSDVASSICSPGERRSEVWIKVADNRDVIFNVETGAASPSAKPAWCSPRPGTSCSGHAFAGDACAATSEETNDFYKAGLSARLVLRASDTRSVAIAQKSPGTPVSMLVSFDPRTRAIAWQVPVAPDPALASSSSTAPATLAGNMVYTTYKTTSPKEVHVTAFDITSGKRVLDFKIPRAEDGTEPGDITVSQSRIYVPHWTWLDIFDARNGKYIETVGMW